MPMRRQGRIKVHEDWDLNVGKWREMMYAMNSD